MKERPILFSAPMIRAILDGTKTQTRRVVKPQPPEHDHATRHHQRLLVPRCPYGQPGGDRLWVRETCRAEELPSGLDGVRYLADGAFRQIENTPAASEAWCAMHAYRGKRGATVPPIHMPRWASRILLEIAGVRVERLQDISEADAMAEGEEPIDIGGDNTPEELALLDLPVMEPDYPYRNGYALLWESINGPGSWSANPFVWVVSFLRIKP